MRGGARCWVRCGVRYWVLAALAWLSTGALADDREADALRLADDAPQQVARASEWRSFVEAAFAAARQRGDGAVGHERHNERRLSLDLRFDHAFSPTWRAVWADRLDIRWPTPGSSDNAVNTVKEAYLSRQLAHDALLDLGRVNVRHGVAMGYNPTDHFRAGALRSAASIAPESLKENRQGSVMLRGQQLWEGGALTAVVSPQLGKHAHGDGFSLDWGATNPRHRALLAWSQKLTETVRDRKSVV